MEHDAIVDDVPQQIVMLRNLFDQIWNETTWMSVLGNLNLSQLEGLRHACYGSGGLPARTLRILNALPQYVAVQNLADLSSHALNKAKEQMLHSLNMTTVDFIRSMIDQNRGKYVASVTCAASALTNTMTLAGRLARIRIDDDDF